MAPTALGLWALAGGLGWSTEARAQPPAPSPTTPTPPTPQAPAPGSPPVAAAAPGGTNPALEPFEGRVIREVGFEGLKAPAAAPPPAGGGAGLDAAAEAALVGNQIRSEVGSPLRERTVQQDIQRLVRLGRFSSVAARVLPFDDGTVKLVYTVVSAPVVLAVDVVGNRTISNQDLLPEIDRLTNTPIDRYQIDRVARRIRELYRKKGYYDADVSVDERELEKTGTLILRIREGERLSLTEIRFEGNATIPESELGGQVKSRVWGLFSSGAIDDLALDQDVAAIINYYRDRGYLDVRADRQLRLSPNNREAVVTFVIEEGPVYTVRSVRVEQDAGTAEGFSQPSGTATKVISPEQARGLLSLKPGDVFSADRVRRSTTALRDAYWKMGFIDAVVRTEVVRNPGKPEADLLVTVREGVRSYTGLVTIAGNDLTQQKVIRREVRVQPDRPLDRTELELADQRLREVQLFAPSQDGVRLTLQKADPETPQVRDLLVQTKETNTGRLSFGVAAGSDSGLIGTISLTQRNFDVMDTPDTPGEFFSGRAFRGGGQTFSLNLSPGTEVQEYTISLSEPALLDSDYSGSAGGGFRSREFDQYSQELLGGSASIGRRFGNLWTGALTLRGDAINIRGIEPSAPRDVFAVQGNSSISAVGASLARRDLDSYFRPTKGSVINLAVERVGALGGSYNLTKIAGSVNIWAPLAEDVLGRKTVLKLLTSVNYIPESNDRVPVFERYYLGGTSFRGFKFRGVGPIGIRNDTGTPGGDPVGGTFGFFLGGQIERPVVGEFLSVVGFIDSGTVAPKATLSPYRVSVGMGVRIYIPGLSPAPVALDFGFPVKRLDSDQKQVFTFSFDLPF